MLAHRGVQSPGSWNSSRAALKLPALSRTRAYYCEFAIATADTLEGESLFGYRPCYQTLLAHVFGVKNTFDELTSVPIATIRRESRSARVRRRSYRPFLALECAFRVKTLRILSKMFTPKFVIQKPFRSKFWVMTSNRRGFRDTASLNKLFDFRHYFKVKMLRAPSICMLSANQKLQFTSSSELVAMPTGHDREFSILNSIS